MNETRRVSIKCHFLPSLAYAKSHVFDGPMFVKLAMLSQQKYSTRKKLKKKNKENKFQLISCNEKKKSEITKSGIIATTGTIL